MSRRNESERGLAAVEFALVLPILGLLLFMLVEGASAIKTYSIMQEASREGARMVLRNGETDQVRELIEALAPDLDPDHLSATVTTDPAQNTVTVEVGYEYQSFLGDNQVLALFDPDPYVFRASTTMPLP